MNEKKLGKNQESISEVTFKTQTARLPYLFISDELRANEDPKGAIKNLCEVWIP